MCALKKVWIFYLAYYTKYKLIYSDEAGKVVLVVGSGSRGKQDGDAAIASFHNPQGSSFTTQDEELRENTMIFKDLIFP